MVDELARRKNLTFEQAEGVDPLPQQLQLREVSQELRARLWNKVYNDLSECVEITDYGSSYLDKPWSTILRDEHVYHKHGMVDDFKNDSKVLTQNLRTLFGSGDYVQIFGWLEFILKHPRCT
jgi:hypothetical protein